MRDLPRRSERLKKIVQPEATRQLPNRQAKKKAVELTYDKYLKQNYAIHHPISCWTTQMQHRKSLNSQDDATLLFGFDWYEDSRSYTVKLYTYLENVSVHPKAGTIEYMHPLALLIQSQEKWFALPGMRL